MSATIYLKIDYQIDSVLNAITAKGGENSQIGKLSNRSKLSAGCWLVGNNQESWPGLWLASHVMDVPWLGTALII